MTRVFLVVSVWCRLSTNSHCLLIQNRFELCLWLIPVTVFIWFCVYRLWRWSMKCTTATTDTSTPLWSSSSPWPRVGGDHARHLSSWCDIHKVMQVVHGHWSVSHCKWSDTRLSILPLVKTLLPSHLEQTHTHTYTRARTHTHTHTHCHAHTHTHTHTHHAHIHATCILCVCGV